MGWRGGHLLFSQQQILACGFGQPKLRPFMGAIGETFYKLYKPFLPYKDELAIWD